MAKHPEIVSPDTRVRMVYGPEAASQAFVAGNLVYLSGGKVMQASNVTKISGIAATAATGVTDTDMEFRELRAGDIIELPTVSAASAVGAATLTIGKGYGMVDVSSVSCIEKTDVLNAQFIFRGAVPLLDDSTSYRGYFEVSVLADQFSSPEITGVPEIVSIPIAIVAATTVNDTGYDLPEKCYILDVFLDIVTAEATGTTKTIDVGTLASDSGDEDGFLDAASVAATGIVRGILTNAAVTRGVLLKDDEDGSGAMVPMPCVAPGSRSVTYTLPAADYAELVGTINIVLIRLA